MKKNMNILLDAMGGDNAPDANIKGAIKAITQIKADVTLIGKEEIIRAKVKEFTGKEIEEVSERLKIKKWDEMTQEDYQELLNSQYTNDYIEKLWFNQNDAFQSLYYMNNRFNQDEFIQKINHIFKDQDCGHVMRVKGFYQKEKHWYEINMTQEDTSIQEITWGSSYVSI